MYITHITYEYKPLLFFRDSSYQSGKIRFIIGDTNPPSKQKISRCKHTNAGRESDGLLFKA